MTPKFVSCALDDVLQITKSLGIDFVWSHVQDTNTANDNPYHNLFHTMSMVKNVYQGARFHNLPNIETTSLVVAALFHDYDHSGGLWADCDNVKLAATKFWKFYNANANTLGLLINAGLTDACIRVTEFPFVLEPVTLAEEIIRDADMLQISEPYWFEMTTLGIKAEFETKIGQSISMIDYLRGQISFVNNHFKHYTEWGKMRANAPLVTKRREAYQQILDILISVEK